MWEPGDDCPGTHARTQFRETALPPIVSSNLFHPPDHLFVDAPGPDEGRIELLWVIGGHDHDAVGCIHHTIQHIEKACACGGGDQDRVGIISSVERSLSDCLHQINPGQPQSHFPCPNGSPDEHPAADQTRTFVLIILGTLLDHTHLAPSSSPPAPPPSTAHLTSQVEVIIPAA